MAMDERMELTKVGAVEFVFLLCRSMCLYVCVCVSVYGSFTRLPEKSMYVYMRKNRVAVKKPCAVNPIGGFVK